MHESRSWRRSRKFVWLDEIRSCSDIIFFFFITDVLKNGSMVE